MSRTFEVDHNRLFDNLENVLKKDLTSTALEANGGRSVLFVYPPNEDEEYIAEGKRRLNGEDYKFIDIREVFTKYVEEIGQSNFEEILSNFGKEVYRSENGASGTFFEFLMNVIVEAENEDKSPVIVHTGAFYDMGISNIHIMEDTRVMRAKHQLVVFYPATVEGETIKFLGKVPASRYRCIVIK